MDPTGLTRRTMLKSAALTTTALAAPFVHGACAAGKLSCGFWDHWVPGANEPLAKLCREWADREKVGLTIDFITSQGDKLALTATAEAQARSGHDVLQMSDWYVAAQADNLEPVDELVISLINEHGEVLLGSEYIGRQKGKWIAVPTGLQTTGQIPCARIDYLKRFVGLDVTRMYPAGAPPDQALADAWTWEGFLAAAEKCAKEEHPFGMPLSTWSDSVNWVSAVFAAHDAQLVDGEGNITVKSERVKAVLEWFKRMVPFLPSSVFAWDNAANNKWLISGKGALIMNPPGAWTVAVRDAPKVAEQLWTFHSPKGPKGRFDPCNFGFWGIWNFSANKTAAKSLLVFLSTRSSVEKLVAGSHGVDIPPFEKLRDFKTWAEERPPAGTLYNYPPRGDVTALLAGYPAPARLGAQMFAQGTICKMVSQCTQQGKSIDQAIDFAQSELEGFMRS
jgi:ABC-type glycerol-3-phosphate transport system substrate-binding protein